MTREHLLSPPQNKNSCKRTPTRSPIGPSLNRKTKFENHTALSGSFQSRSPISHETNWPNHGTRAAVRCAFIFFSRGFSFTRRFPTLSKVNLREEHRAENPHGLENAEGSNWKTIDPVTLGRSSRPGAPSTGNFMRTKRASANVARVIATIVDGGRVVSTPPPQFSGSLVLTSSWVYDICMWSCALWSAASRATGGASCEISAAARGVHPVSGLHGTNLYTGSS